MWLCPLQVDNNLIFIHRRHLFRHVGYLRQQQQDDLLTLKVVSKSRVTWATSIPILVFLGLSVLELGLMYATDVRRQTDRRQTKASLNASGLWGGGIIMSSHSACCLAEQTTQLTQSSIVVDDRSVRFDEL